jgi:biopolymer transport protein ExbB
MSLPINTRWNLAKKFLFIICLATVGLLVVDVVYAQEEGVPQATKSWFELFKTTGIVGALLLLLSISGFALVIEHFVNLRNDKITPPDLVGQVDEALETGDTERAYELCQAQDSYLSRVVKSGLEAGGTGEVAIEAARDTAVEETFGLNTKISYLSLVGNLGPLMGLLGTVTGMITSFQEIETKKAPTPADLAKGVYESLMNATIGLFVAIVFLTMYFIFKNKVAKMTMSANNTAYLLLRDRTAST